MYKELLLKIAKYLGSNVLFQFSNLVTVFILMAALTVEEYGEYFYVVEILAIFAMIAESGTRSFYIKEISGSSNGLSTLKSINSVHFLISIIAFIIILLASRFIQYDKAIFILIGFGYTLSSIFVPLQAFCIANERVNLIAIREQVIGVSRLAYFAVGWIYNLPLIYYFFYIYLQVAIIFVFWMSVKKTEDIDLFSRDQITLETLKILISLIPFSLLVVINLIYNKIDIFMLEVYSDYESVGIYVGATKLVYPFMFLSGVFMSAVFPRMSKYANDQRKLQDVTNFSLTSLPLLGVAVAAILIPLSNFIFGNLWDGKFHESLTVFRLLVFYLPVVFTYGVLTNIIVAKGRTWTLMLINGVGLLANIFFNSYLIPRYGAFGAAISTMVCEIYILYAAMFYSKFKIDIDIRKRHFLFVFLLTVIVVSYGFTLY